MHLILTRKEGESVVLFTGAEEQVVITVEKYDNGQIKLGFSAPDSVNIMREELLDRER